MAELGLTLVLVEGSGGGSEEGSEDSGRELHVEQLSVVGELNEGDWRRAILSVNKFIRIRGTPEEFIPHDP